MFGREGYCYWPFHADDDDQSASQAFFDPMPYWAERAIEENGGEKVSDRLDCGGCPCFDEREEAKPESTRCPDTPDMFAKADAE
jgi:hypothetical protein